MLGWTHRRRDGKLRADQDRRLGFSAGLVHTCGGDDAPRCANVACLAGAAAAAALTLAPAAAGDEIAAGRGAYGVVRLCRRRSDNVLVIIKEIPVEEMTLEERQAALNEVKVWSRLRVLVRVRVRVCVLVRVRVRVQVVLNRSRPGPVPRAPCPVFLQGARLDGPPQHRGVL